MKVVKYSFITIVTLILCIVGVKCMTTSEYSNCVIVEKTSDFDGKWLKNNINISMKTTLTSECKMKDNEIDNGDGNKQGRIRWAECLAGPDCSEAGNF